MKLSINEQEKRIVYQNFFHYFAWLLGAKKHQDCYYTKPNVPYAVFNSVIDTKLNQQNAEKVIEEIKSLYHETKPFCWWVTDFVPSTLQTNLVKANFERGDPFVGMVYPLSQQIMLPPEVSHIEVKTLIDPNRLSEWIKPMQDAFVIDPLSAQYCVNVFKENFNDKRIKHFYVEEQGNIIGTGTLFIENNVSGFYNLAVVPSWRNQKVASALKWHRLKVSQELGASFAILQSSNMGRELDMRLGFKPVSEFIPYFSPMA